MKTFTLLLAAGLASASVHLPRQVGANNLNLNLSGASNIGVNGPNLGDFNLADLSLNRLQVGGLNLGSVDLRNQDVVAEAILAMLRSFCLGNALDRNRILSFGFNNDVDLFFQLAQLMQLEQLGFVDLGGIQSLINRGQVLGGFNLGVFKREISDAKKTMRRTKLRRGEKAKRQCVVGGAEDEQIFNIATAPPSPLATETATATADEAGFTIATAPAAAQTVSLIDAAASAAAIAASVAAAAAGDSAAATAVAEVTATATAAATTVAQVSATAAAAAAT